MTNPEQETEDQRGKVSFSGSHSKERWRREANAGHTSPNYSPEVVRELLSPNVPPMEVPCQVEEVRTRAFARPASSPGVQPPSTHPEPPGAAAWDR